MATGEQAGLEFFETLRHEHSAALARKKKEALIISSHDEKRLNVLDFQKYGSIASPDVIWKSVVASRPELCPTDSAGNQTTAIDTHKN